MTAEELHHRGREAGERGDFQEAIRLFELAHAADSEWPYPIYDLAFSYLLLKDFEKALAYYKRCNEMAPNGYYASKTAIWTMEKEAMGLYPKGMYLNYSQLEWKDETERKLVLYNMINDFPDFAPAYKSLQSLIQDPEDRMKLIEKGLELDADDETYSMLLISKALLMSFTEKMPEAIQMLSDYLNSERKTLMGSKIASSIIEQWQSI
jgi:tetratricopeptide (TPR) repeat protein